jgi:hypothetical protein
LLAVVTLGLVTASRRWSVLARLAVGPWLLTLTAFLLSTAWWSQYNAHLIASEALVAGGVFALLPARWRTAALLASVLSLAVSLGHTVKRGLAPSDEQLALARSPLRDSPACVFTFEPGWSLAAGRLPPRQTGPLIDSYATQLLQAVQGRRRFENTGAAFSSLAGPPAGLLGCDYLLLGARGARQLSLEALEVTHRQTAVGTLLVWQRRP